MTQSDFENGLQTRKQVLGESYVENALGQANELDEEFQQFITETAWGKVWGSDAITLRERSMLVVAILAALGHEKELSLHLNACRNTGATAEDIREVLMHVAVYAGVPAANRAFKIAREVFAETPSE